MACVVNPDGTITCSGDDTYAVAEQIWSPTQVIPSSINAQNQATAVTAALTAAGAVEKVVVILDAAVCRTAFSDAAAKAAQAAAASQPAGTI